VVFVRTFHAGIVKNAMARAAEHGFQPVAFPPIGATVGGFNRERAGEIIEEELGKLSRTNCIGHSSPRNRRLTMWKMLITLILALLPAAVSLAAGPPREQALKQRYDAFVESLKHRSLAEDYPGAVRNLDSEDRSNLCRAVTAANPLSLPLDGPSVRCRPAVRLLSRFRKAPLPARQ
jgi:hypothetical protein